MIDEKQITFIVQGPYINSVTSKVLNYLINKFSNSKFIFSTWKNNRIGKINLKKIKIIRNKDPGAFRYCDDPILYYSYQRQVKSTLVGLKNAKTKYCIKIRSDCIISNNNFIKYFEKFKKKSKEYNILEKRVLISSNYTIDPNKIDLPFHFSDWFYFGLKKDLLKIFKQNYRKKENDDIANWYKTNKKPLKYHSNYFCKFRIEQNIIKNFLKKYINFSFRNGYDNSEKNIILTEKILSNNFIIFDPPELGLISFKNKLFNKNGEILYFNGLIKNYNWQKLYKKYCDKTFIVKKIETKLIFKTLIWMISNPREVIYRILTFNKIIKHR